MMHSVLKSVLACLLLMSVKALAISVANGGVSLSAITVRQPIGRQYKGSINGSTEIILEYHYNETANASTAVRVSVSSDADIDNPVLFVVRQHKGVLSWQVPIIFQSNYFHREYSNVSRTLCPQDSVSGPVHRASGLTIGKHFFIEVATSSMTSKAFTVNTTVLGHPDAPAFEIAINTEHNYFVSPPEPQYYQFTFPPGVEAVNLRFTSSDSLCMDVSVQDISCPVYDLDRNIQFTGMYQSMTTKAALVVQRSDFQRCASFNETCSFHVVFLVKPNNYECTGYALIEPANKTPERVKHVELYVVKALPVEEYVTAMVVAFCFFFGFYVMSLLIACVRFIKAHIRNPPSSHVEETERLTPEVAIMPGSRSRGQLPARSKYGSVKPANAPPGEGSAPMYGSSSSAGENSVNGGPGSEPADEGSSGYRPAAAVGPPGSSSSQGPGQRPRDAASRQRAAMSSGDSDSSIEEADIDMLSDADDDKDIFRTKTFLYVSDLARKSRKVLNKKYKLYQWYLITVAVFYALPVVQLVITYQTVLHVTGNEDICYYNFFCYRPLGVLSAFNNVYSNIGFVMLGVLFLILVYRRDLIHRRELEEDGHAESTLGIPRHYGLFYAMGLALIMEGVLSACYHVCPSYTNFQFDTSFMYMIAVLCMLKMYQNRHPDVNANASAAYAWFAFIILVAVLGVVYGTLVFWVVFAVVHINTTLALSAQIYYMGRWRLNIGIVKRIWVALRQEFVTFSRPMYPDRMVLLVVGNLLNWSAAIFGVVVRPRDFASYILAIFIANLLFYFAFYICMKLRYRERITILPLFYILAAVGVWIAALYFFTKHITSWQVTPAQSREHNQECALFDFYDYHDVWHFLSSIALFFSFMILLTLDDDLAKTPRDKIPVF